MRYTGLNALYLPRQRCSIVTCPSSSAAVRSFNYAAQATTPENGIIFNSLLYTIRAPCCGKGSRGYYTGSDGLVQHWVVVHWSIAGRVGMGRYKVLARLTIDLQQLLFVQIHFRVARLEMLIQECYKQVGQLRTWVRSGLRTLPAALPPCCWSSAPSTTTLPL